MPPEGYQAITADEETFDLLTEVMIEYDCGSVAEAVTKSSTIALKTDEIDLAQLLADQLSDRDTVILSRFTVTACPKVDTLQRQHQHF